VTIAYPGVVATGIRHRGFNAQGQAAGKSGLDERGRDERRGVRAPDRRGHRARRRDIVMSAKGKLGRWLKLIAPAMVDRMALKALNRP
jgi:hypothetical protein